MDGETNTIDGYKVMFTVISASFNSEAPEGLFMWSYKRKSLIIIENTLAIKRTVQPL